MEEYVSTTPHPRAPLPALAQTDSPPPLHRRGDKISLAQKQVPVPFFSMNNDSNNMDTDGGSDNYSGDEAIYPALMEMEVEDMYSKWEVDIFVPIYYDINDSDGTYNQVSATRDLQEAYDQLLKAYYSHQHTGRYTHDAHVLYSGFADNAIGYVFDHQGMSFLFGQQDTAEPGDYVPKFLEEDFPCLIQYYDALDKVIAQGVQHILCVRKEHKRVQQFVERGWDITAMTGVVVVEQPQTGEFEVRMGVKYEGLALHLNQDTLEITPQLRKDPRYTAVVTKDPFTAWYELQQPHTSSLHLTYEERATMKTIARDYTKKYAGQSQAYFDARMVTKVPRGQLPAMRTDVPSLYQALPELILDSEDSDYICHPRPICWWDDDK
eukprot:jgi/Chrzof1/10425/UNPLg00351.t1